MMTKLLLIKDKVRTFYGSYDVYILPVAKFLVSFLSFIMLKSTLGYMSRLGSLPVMLVAALICSMLPAGGMVLFFSLFFLGHVYAVSIEAFLVCAVLLCIMFLVYYIFKPGDSLILVVTPLLFWIRLPYLLPLAAGLMGGLLTAIPASFGVVIYYMIQAVRQNVTALTEVSETSSMLTRFQLMVDQMVTNRSMYVMILAVVVAIILVYALRRMAFAHNWTIAIGVGAVAEFVMVLGGGMALNVSRQAFPVLPLIVEILISALLALALEFMIYGVDFSRTEYVQFEDDEYYYYVKAVPKMNVTPEQKEVKHFAVSQKGRANGMKETVDLGDNVKNLAKRDSLPDEKR
jgi:hypothetical protein